jgi:hypothetical protein
MLALLNHLYAGTIRGLKYSDRFYFSIMEFMCGRAN